MFPVLRRVPALGLQQVGFVFLDAHLVHARNRAPEAHEIVHLARVALHAHHLHHHLNLGPAFVLHAREPHEIVAHFLEIGAFAVVLVGVFGRAVETQRDVLQRRIQQPRAGLLIEESSVGRQQRRNIMVLAVLDAIENLAVHERLAQPDQHHMLGALPRFAHQTL